MAYSTRRAHALDRLLAVTHVCAIGSRDLTQLTTSCVCSFSHKRRYVASRSAHQLIGTGMGIASEDVVLREDPVSARVYECKAR